MQNSSRKPLPPWGKYLFWVFMGALGAFCGLWMEYHRPILPPSGFTYEVKEGDQVWRVRGIFDRSQVTGAQIRPIATNRPERSAWVLLSDAGQSMMEGEPRGLCLLDHDGVYSGFIELSPDQARAVRGLEASQDGLVLTVLLTGSEKGLSFSAQTLEPITNK